MTSTPLPQSDNSFTATGTVSRPKVTAWLFGTFNPVHNGHWAMAQAALDANIPACYGGGIVNKVVWVPAYRSPWKYADPAMLPYEERVAMVQATIADEPRFVLSTLEAELAEQSPGPVYTWPVLQALHQQGNIPAWPAFVIAGEDTLAHISQWHAAEILCQHVVWLLALREAEPARLLDASTASVPPLQNMSMPPLNTIPLAMPPMAVSSSKIRQLWTNHPQNLPIPKPALDMLHHLSPNW